MKISEILAIYSDRRLERVWDFSELEQILEFRDVQNHR